MEQVHCINCWRLKKRASLARGLFCQAAALASSSSFILIDALALEAQDMHREADANILALYTVFRGLLFQQITEGRHLFSLIEP